MLSSIIFVSVKNNDNTQYAFFAFFRSGRPLKTSFSGTSDLKLNLIVNSLVNKTFWKRLSVDVLTLCHKAKCNNVGTYIFCVETHTKCRNVVFGFFFCFFFCFLFWFFLWGGGLFYLFIYFNYFFYLFFYARSRWSISTQKWRNVDKTIMSMAGLYLPIWKDGQMY